MKKFLILFSMILILFACDRFEHEVFTSAKIETVFADFSEILVNTDSIDSVMVFYHDDYMNNAFDKEEIRAQFLGYFNDFDSLIVELNSYYHDLSIEWTLSGILAGENNITEIATFSDILLKTDSGYQFYGNQIEPPEYDPSKPMVVAQFSTATTCGNCPAATEILAELDRTFGGQFIYLEYVLDGPDPTSNFYPFVQYYEIYSQPTVVFQGTSIAEGSDEETLNSYFTRYEQAAEIEKVISISLQDIVITINNVSGTAIIDSLDNIQSDNLKLETALISKNSNYEYQLNHQELHNVVFAVETYDIGNYEIDFSIDSTIDIIEEALLVVWVQTKEDSFNSQTCKIYDATIYDF